MIRIAHVNKTAAVEGIKIYCGRSHGDLKASPVRNPFYAIPGQPGATLPDYRKWLAKAMLSPKSPQAQEIQRIKKLAQAGDVVLTCWCHDSRTCHCSVIKQVVEGELEQDAVAAALVEVQSPVAVDKAQAKYKLLHGLHPLHIVR